MILLGIVCGFAACVAAVRGEWEMFGYCLLGVLLCSAWLDWRYKS